MKKNLYIALILAAIGMVAGIFIVPYQMETMSVYLSPDVFDPNDLPIPLTALIALASVQLGIATFVASILGIILARKVNLKLPILDALVDRNQKIKVSGRWLMYAILLGMLGGFTIIAADLFYFQHHIPLIAENPPAFSFNGLIAGVLYGGVIEEVLIRLFLMSLVVWVLYKLFARRKAEVPTSFYWIAIVFAAVIFAVGHFPTTQVVFGELSSILIIRSLLLNGLFGIVFGYLYWRRGIEYAMFSHMTAHISMQLLFIPMFY
ncbi:CPBP family intramembrane glutamic endopeptidase [Alkalihalobacterium elongatum]|uniref:CPBP family intramembrane glutamic endopeptidase n=1 Tax=Alkalihalobacterium elongatum TaxID=2675466 RepID=UPI001C1FDACD|nr:CPBP family intramembrane glutamic endopeptidase [Alkalihalobacterium elongatum]